MSGDAGEPEVADVDESTLVCRSEAVLGHGQIDVQDVVVVDFHRFERSKSQSVAQQVSRFNARLAAEGRGYLLIGVGRWGSSDPYLGIPVAWNQIAGCRAIVEAGFRDFKVTPSQGSHFFQNLTSSNVGYFTVNPEAGQGVLDWDWLAAQPAIEEAESVRLLRFEAPVAIVMNGRTNTGVIGKPGVVFKTTPKAFETEHEEPRWR